MSDIIEGGGYDTYIKMTGYSDIPDSDTKSDGENVNDEDQSTSAHFPILWNSTNIDDRSYESDMLESGTLSGTDSDIGLSSDMEEEREFSSNKLNKHYDGNKQEEYVYIDPNTDSVRKCDRKFFSFIDGHPLGDTHHVNCMPEIE